MSEASNLIGPVFRKSDLSEGTGGDPLTFLVEGVEVCPAFQFSPEGLRHDVAQVVSEMRARNAADWSIAIWLRTQAALDESGRTAEQMLADGEIEKVTEHARATAERWDG